MRAERTGYKECEIKSDGDYMSCKKLSERFDNFEHFIEQF